jgi:hypothetical protein
MNGSGRTAEADDQATPAASLARVVTSRTKDATEFLRRLARVAHRPCSAPLARAPKDFPSTYHSVAWPELSEKGRFPQPSQPRVNQFAHIARPRQCQSGGGGGE